MTTLPPSVAAALGHSLARVTVREEPMQPGTGVATSTLTRLHIKVDGATDSSVTTLIRKGLRPLDAGRHRAGAHDPKHWAYWRREAEAYASGLLPAADLRAPRCLGLVDDDLYLEDVSGPAPSVARAAQVLATWQVPFTTTRDRRWLSRDQIGRRLEVSELDWHDIDADPRIIDLWARRREFHDALTRLPQGLAHGDYHLGNLIATGDQVVALDWATMGWEPAGFDLAHLALSSGVNPIDAYMEARRDDAVEAHAVESGFRAAVAIIGASRTHWMLSNDVPLPEWYADFVLANAL